MVDLFFFHFYSVIRQNEKNKSSWFVYNIYVLHLREHGQKLRSFYRFYRRTYTSTNTRTHKRMENPFERSKEDEEKKKNMSNGVSWLHNTIRRVSMFAKDAYTCNSLPPLIRNRIKIPFPHASSFPLNYFSYSWPTFRRCKKKKGEKSGHLNNNEEKKTCSTMCSNKLDHCGCIFFARILNTLPAPFT